MKLTKEQIEIFKPVLLANTRDDLALPTEWETDMMYRMKKYRYHDYDSRGGEDLRFFLKQNKEGNLFLDFFFITDDYTSHYRIDQTSALIRLENMEGQFGWPVYEDEAATNKEHDRIKANNIMVHAILQQKGLDGVDEQGKPLFEMSTILIRAEWYTETKKLAL
jgi:hypothetical protein